MLDGEIGRILAILVGDLKEGYKRDQDDGLGRKLQRCMPSVCRLS